MSIEHFSRTVAARKIDLEVAEASFADAADQAKQIHRRIAAIRARASEITQARLDGTADASSAAELFDLNEDVKVLDDLHEDAVAHAETLRPDRERAALAQAERDLHAATERARFDALVQHAKEVETRFKRCLAAVLKSARQRGARTAGECFPLDADLSACIRQNTWLAADGGG